MIKHILLCVVLLLLTGDLRSQTVPNFIAEDIDGISHNLYTYLNEDKVVILDVFATWCTGCWISHKQEKLANLYKTYGPEGTDQLMIMFVEGDPQTSDEALYNDNPFGDWTKNVPYPIFNPNQLDTTFIQAFASNGVPTTNVICPNARENIADIFDSDLAEIIEIIQECNSISNVVDLQILGEREELKPICISTNINVEVLNTGTEVIETFKVSASENGGVGISDYIYKGNLLPGELISIDLGSFTLLSVIDNQIVNLLIETEDDVAFNNTQIIDYSHSPEVRNELLLTIRSDFWAVKDNTRWWIENSANERVSPINQLESLTDNEFRFFLENNDCFTFVITEDFGDGMVLGEITLHDDQGNILYEDVNFGFRGEGSFEYLGSAVTATSTLNEKLFQLKVLPNIVTNDLQIQYQVDSSQSTTLSIYNTQGQQVHTDILDGSTSISSMSIDVHDYPNGIYFVTIENEDGVLTERFVKQ